MILPVALLILFATSSANNPSPRCDCLTAENTNKSENHLRLISKITAMKLLPAVREIILHSHNEKLFLLDETSYYVIKDLQDTYGMLITHTDFHHHFVGFIEKMKTIVNNEEDRSIRAIHSALSVSLRNLYSLILPSTFLCLSMGECLSAPPKYVECMKENAPQWTAHFGKEPEKMARRLAETIHRYKMVDQRLIDIQSMLINAENMISEQCARSYTAVTDCGTCIAERIGYCRDSCETVSADCFREISSDWDENLTSLMRLARDFHEGFFALERGIHSSLRRLVEISSPLLARAVVNTCGSLNQGNIPATRAVPIDNKKPRTVLKKTEKLVEKLQQLTGYWNRISTNLCTQPSLEHFCWNGTNIIRTALAQNSDEATLLKNVRPRPKVDPVFEASGSFPWSDDEDLAEGSGSGNGMVAQDVFNQENAEHTTETKSDSTLPPPTVRPLQDSKDYVVADTAKSTATVILSTILTLLLIV